jgi:hypothetical protein
VAGLEAAVRATELVELLGGNCYHQIFLVIHVATPWLTSL